MKVTTYSWMNRRGLAICLLALFVLLPVLCFGVLPNRTETWDNGQLNSWTDESDKGTLVANPGNCLRISFPAQGIPMPACGGVAGGVDASGGIFSGDYQALSVSNITFSVMTDGHLPAAFRLILRGAKSGREWSCYSLDVSTAAGVWVSNNVPLDYSTGRWTLSGPGASEQDFLKDLKDVDLIGVRLERNGTAAQAYSIDSLCIGGINISGRIRGKITYKGYQEGAVRVVAATAAGDWTGPYVTELTKPGNFEFPDVLTGSNYWVKAYLDANSNGVPDSAEPMGEYPSNSIDMVSDSVNDVDVTLSETVNRAGLPMWWVLENSMGPDGTNMTADADDDGDGVSNLMEYIAGTDPNDASSTFKAIAERQDPGKSKLQGMGNGIVLKWKAPHSNKKYEVWRATDLTSGFSLLEGGVVATPPENSYEDVTADGNGPYFYRIKIAAP